MNNEFKINGNVLEITLPEEVHIDKVIVNRQIFSQRMQVCESCKYHGLEGHEEPCVSCEVGNSNYVEVEETHWIPCSERLPNENDYNSCMECLDGAVWYFTENGAMGLGYYYESTKEWSTTDDLKTDGKVIAWMPLPEPYQEVEE